MQVRAFTAAAGVPSPATGSPFTTNLTSVSDGVLSPNNNFYVVAERVDNQFGSYQISGTGAATTLTAVAGSLVASNGSNTNALVFNSTGTFLFAANKQKKRLQSSSLFSLISYFLM